MTIFPDPTRELQRLDVLAQVDPLLVRDVFQPLVAQVTTLLTRHADSRGRIPLQYLPAIRQGAERLVVQTMLGRTGNQEGVPHPYVESKGRVYPQSPYFLVLWELLRRAVEQAIAFHADVLRSRLPADQITRLERATRVPDFLDARYPPLHHWPWPDGKQVADRIWTITGDMHRKLDAYLTQVVVQEQALAKTAEALEVLFSPVFVDDNAGLLDYEAFRLARTEVSAAGSHAGSAAAQLDPFVETYSFFTAPQHRCCDICDQVEAGSPYPADDTQHLAPQHGNCICGVIWHLSANKKDVTPDDDPFIGPLSPAFVDWLFRGRN